MNEKNNITNNQKLGCFLSYPLFLFFHDVLLVFNGIYLGFDTYSLWSIYSDTSYDYCIPCFQK